MTTSASLLSKQRGQRICHLVILSIACVQLTGRAASPSSLDAPCPVDWQGVPLTQAVDELADRLGLTCVLDASVSADVAGQRVRLVACHLTGRQALSWLARWAGLEVGMAETTAVLAPPGRLPAVWRRFAMSRPASDDDRHLAALLARRAKFGCVDAPLSLVARQVADRFNVDLIFHPDLLAEQKLIQVAPADRSLEDFCRIVADQLQAKRAYLDGAFWIHRPAREGMPATAPAQPPLNAVTPAEKTIAVARDRLLRTLVIDRPPASWPALAGQLFAATGLDCRVRSADTSAPPSFEAAGSVFEILEAGRLLKMLDYHIEPGDGRHPATLLITVP